MRFHLGPIPNSPEFSPDASWKALREPSVWVAQFIALPLGILSAVLIGLFWFAFTPLRMEAVDGTTVPKLFATLVGIVFVHELLHMTVHPRAGWWAHSILGFWPTRLIFYAHFDGTITRNRFLAILLMPLLIMSILPLVVAVITQFASGWAVFISITNSLFAAVDILGAVMIVFQVPATAIVRNQGWQTYFRAGETVA